MPNTEPTDTVRATGHMPDFFENCAHLCSKVIDRARVGTLALFVGAASLLLPSCASQHGYPHPEDRARRKVFKSSHNSRANKAVKRNIRNGGCGSAGSNRINND